MDEETRQIQMNLNTGALFSIGNLLRKLEDMDEATCRAARRVVFDACDELRAMLDE